MSKSKHVILGVTGSIAAYKAGDIIRRLKDKKYRVSVIMTKEARHFISPLTLASLSAEKVYEDMFSPDDNAYRMAHIALAEEAQVFLVAPATANVIGKIAHGIADDLLTCIAMVTHACVLIAPAMNTHMYANKIVQENMAKLKKLGVRFIGPDEGKLACGTCGEGHLADVDDIVKAVEQVKQK